MTRNVTVALSALLLVSACRGLGDPVHSEFVINQADTAFVLRYEEPGLSDYTRTVAVPAHSSGVGQGGNGESWSGTIVVMNTDCAVLGRIEVSAKLSLVNIAADGTFALVTEGINGRSDLNGGHYLEETTRCPT